MWNQRDLIAVETAIASGEIEVHYSDRSVRYRSVDELLKAREVIQAALTVNARPRSRQIVPGSGY